MRLQHRNLFYFYRKGSSDSMLQKIKSENGMAIVEATYVFPIIVIIVFLLIYVGNGYWQKCKIESIVTKAAIQGAAYCGNPLTEKVDSKNFPDVNSLNVYPYRHLFTGKMNEIESSVESSVKKEIAKVGSGLFSNMNKVSSSVETEYDAAFLYSTFLVDVDYKIRLPLKILWQDDYFYITFTSRVEVPVTDSTEYIRTFDTVIDYMEKTGLMEKFDDTKKEFTDLVNKVGDGIKNLFKGD